MNGGFLLGGFCGWEPLSWGSVGCAGSLASPVACLHLVGLLFYSLRDRSPVHFSLSMGVGMGGRHSETVYLILAAHVALRSLGDLSAQVGVSFKRSFQK